MLFPSGCRLLVLFGWIAEDGGDRRARLPWLLTEPVADFVARTGQETTFWEISPVKSAPVNWTNNVRRADVRQSMRARRLLGDATWAALAGPACPNA
jgi:hypothetical protein